MDTKALNEMGRLSLIAERIREMRDILGFSVEEMAEKTEVSKEEYELYEQGKTDMPSPSFTSARWCSESSLWSCSKAHPPIFHPTP